VNAPIKSVDPETAVADVAAAITFTAQVSQNRSIVIQTYMPRDAPVSEFHETLDKMTKSVDRQQAKLDMEELLANLAQEEKTLKGLEEDFLAIEPRAQAVWNARKNGPFKLSQQELAQKATARTNIERFREAIAKRNAEIAKCQARIDARE